MNGEASEKGGRVPADTKMIILKGLGPWARAGMEEARGFAGDEPFHREGTGRVSARCDARYSVNH